MANEVLLNGVRFDKVKYQKAELAHLSANHLADLRASGLDDPTILANGFRTEHNPVVLARLLNWDRPATSLGPCLIIPFLGPDGKPLPAIDKETGAIVLDESGDPVPYVRVKPNKPRKDKKKAGKVYKYESRRGARNYPYIPAGVWALLADPTIRVLLIEGEKKAAALAQAGYCAVGLVGVDGWSLPRPKGSTAPRTPLPELQLIDWEAREVVIVYDSDICVKPAVRWAEFNLATALTAMGARVRCARLPDEPDGSKNGADDYIVRRGPVAFAGVVEKAIPATHPKTGRAPFTAPRVDDCLIRGGRG